MIKSKRLKPVVHLAEARERDAARELGQCQRMILQREHRLQELLNFRSEYQQRLQDEGSRGINAGAMQDFRAFIQKLDMAIIQQRGMIQTAVSDYELSKQNWTATRSRSRALGNVVDRYRQQEQHDADRREQRDADERSQRNYLDTD